MGRGRQTRSLAAALVAPALAAGRGKMPEPLLGESITDLDGAAAGEVELDATGLFAPPQAGAPQRLRGSFEVEWRATQRLGLSFVLLHDGADDAHLMAELRGRLLARLLIELDAD